MPGNAGDFKQVRSIASSASRQFFNVDDSKSSHEEWAKPLDFFARSSQLSDTRLTWKVDFNEDFSAFHAQTLEEQGHFLASIIPHVLSAYRHTPPNQRPSRVMLLGHSMGGIVARLAASLVDNTTIDAIITMSTPHQSPPLPFESTMEDIYSTVNSASYRAPHPLLVSICGGVSDTQIVSDSCALSKELIEVDDGFAVFTTAIPGVWTGVEHQATVWCHQLRWRVARAMLDMSMETTRDAKLLAARKWLLGGMPTHPPIDALQVDVPVTASTMAILARIPTITEETLAAPPLKILHCIHERCTEPRWSLSRVPWPRNNSEPFPFPGEGARPQDSILAIDIIDLVVDGSLRLHAPRGTEVSSGLKLDSVASNRWGEYSSFGREGRGTFHLKLTLQFIRILLHRLMWPFVSRIALCLLFLHGG